MSRKIVLIWEQNEPRRQVAEGLREFYEVDSVERASMLSQRDREWDAMVLSLQSEGALETLVAMQKNEAGRSIPVLALSDGQDEAVERRALELGVTDVTRLPIVDALLLQRLRNLIRLRDTLSLRRALERDPLTGIFNRATFARRSAKLIRKHPNDAFVLELWDVEHFKVVNDLHGATVGDRVLRAIAGRLDELLRGVGTYARLENDHFALCYPESAYPTQRLLNSVNASVEALNLGMSLTLYGGEYRVVDRELTVDQMCDRASLALKTVKGNYHNRLAIYDDRMRDRLMLEQEILGEMNGALEQGQFQMYLQPLYSITTGEPISAEALVRWKHPVKGLISPGTFIPLFERNGFITKLDACMWENACRFLREMLDDGERPLPISVNVSRLNLFNPELCNDVIALTEKYDIPPRLLKLEITESAYTDNPDQLLQTMKTLQSKGFEILMDDFGSGYSSLNMLKDVPVDILKMDMRFLDDVDHSSRAGNVMTSVLHMAKWLNIVVIAEGVETREQIEFLRSIGCDRVQGFYYARPMPAEQYRELLRRPSPAKESSDTAEGRLLSEYNFDALWETNKRVNLLLGSMIGAMGMCELNGDDIELVRVNECYYELTGETPQSIFMAQKNVLRRLSPESGAELLEACRRAVRTGEIEQVEIARIASEHPTVWLGVKLRHLGAIGERHLFYFVMTDVTLQREAENRAMLQHCAAVMLDAYDEVLELDFREDSVYAIDGRQVAQCCKLSVDLPRLLVTKAHPDDAAALRQLLDEAYLRKKFFEEKRASVFVDARVRTNEASYRWARFTLYPSKEPSGNLRVILCKRDIDESKQAERIREEYRLLRAKQAERERFGLVTEQTGTAVLEWNGERSGCTCNPFGQEFLLADASGEQLASGELPEDVVDEEDRAALCDFLAHPEDNEHRSVTLRLKRRDGECPWCRLGLAVRREIGGGTHSVIVTVNDVDSEQRTQLLLEAQRVENERRLEMLGNLYWTLPCGILRLTSTEPFRPTFYNRACWQLFGFAHKTDFDRVAGEHICSLLQREQCVGFKQKLLACLSDGQEREFDLSICKANGENGSLHGAVSTIADGEGETLLQLVFLDTTLLNRQEFALRQTQESLRSTAHTLQYLLDSLPVGVALFELDGGVKPQYANDHAYRMFGMKERDMRRFSELMRLERATYDWAHVRRVVEQSPDKRYANEGLWRVKHADDTPFWMRSYCTLTPSGEGAIRCYAVLVDVTQQVEAEREYNRQSELYRMVMEESQVLFFDYDVEQDVLNYSIRSDSGKREDREAEHFAATVGENGFVCAEDREKVLNEIRRACCGQGSTAVEFRADYARRGAVVWCRAHFRSLIDESGTVFRVIGRVDDISEEKSREEQLSRVTMFRRAVNSVSLFMFEFELPQMQPKLLGTEPHGEGEFYPFLEYIDGAQNARIVHSEERAALLNALDANEMLSRYHAGENEINVPFRALNRKQRWVWLQLTIHLSHGDGQSVARGIGYVKVIEDRVALEQKATTDGMTQLLNRATVEERIERALRENTTCAGLMILDVDNFKAINDTCGHAEGDRVLRGVAEALRSHCRQSDVIGRLGGDEFVALLPGASARVAEEKARDLLQAVAEMNESHCWQCSVGVSIGIACAPRDGHTFAQLYNDADKALYYIKNNGKNSCCVFKG